MAPSSRYASSSSGRSGEVNGTMRARKSVDETPTPSKVGTMHDRSRTIKATKGRPNEQQQQSESSHGLLAHIHHLFPTHAQFRVKLQIHQLASVPLVHGEFGIRWKFQNVQSRSQDKSRSRINLLGRPSSRKGKERAEDGMTNGEGVLKNGHVYESDSEAEASRDGSSSRQVSGGSIPAVVVSHHKHHDSLSSTTPSTANASVDSASASSNSNGVNLYSQYLDSDELRRSPSSESPEQPPQPPASPTADWHGRGHTSWLPLRDHSVAWEQKVEVVVAMKVERDTGDLHSNELKLVVMQRVIPGDPDAPHNPRLGAVYLNLAEYADAGPVTRRYLLKDSKTNATLKLTVDLEHVGGVTSYRAPPLPKGEILGGIAGLLENDVYRTRPRTLDLFYTDDFAPAPAPAMSFAAKMGSRLFGGSAEHLPFDMDRLASATTVGPKATEDLIETLFNPRPSAAKTPSPFTYYDARPSRSRASSTCVADAREVSEESSQCSCYTSASAGTHTSTSWRGSTRSHPEPLEEAKRSRTLFGIRLTRSRPGTPLKGQVELPPS